MAETHPSGQFPGSNPWPLVMCLVGVDYFSTLAYLPSIAVNAAGPLAPVAAGGAVLVTFFVALPLYWYIASRAADGRGATGLVEDLTPGWRGKFLVLTLLGFAAADFVITRSLSLADAAVHGIHNLHGQRLLQRLPAGLVGEDHPLWPPLEHLVKRIVEPQVAVTLGLSIISFAAWQILKRGVTRRILVVAAGAVVAYLTLVAIVIGSALVYLAGRPDVYEHWLEAVTTGSTVAVPELAANTWGWSWLSIALWSFPQMALGLSGFEMILTVAPLVRGAPEDSAPTFRGRVRNTRKLMLVAASIMTVYLLSAVLVTTLLVPRDELMPGGAAEHRALAYLAHGSPLADTAAGAVLNPMFGEHFGDWFDLSSAMILCLAGASVTMGLQNLLPHYLNRLGMEVSWAGKIGVILNVLNVIVLLVTVVFRASPSSQQWAYATSVLVLLAGAGLAATKDLAQSVGDRQRVLPTALAAGACGFFLVMTGLTVLINHSGLTIALAFVAAIVTCSIVSRWIRSIELRFEGFDFADQATCDRWQEMSRSGLKVLVPHRPGLVSLAHKSRLLERDYRLDPATPIIFIEAELGDPSNFYQKPFMRIEREGELEVIRLSRCVSISHVLAAVCLELCRDGGQPPEIIFGWSHEPPLAANLNFLLLGEGNIPWMVKELVRRAIPDPAHQPRVRIG
ncbi:MAG TPA: hypothetical protein VHV08_06575 [Pirellulales bacterium]|nr:hypothetical protein [Pirellulales bacterium]